MKMSESMTSTSTVPSKDVHQKKMEQTGKKRRKKIIYPIFQECIRYTLDEFWEDKLDLASRGKFPSKIKYKDGFIFKTSGVKMSSAPICENDPAEALKNFIGFMHSNGIMSDTEREYHEEKNMLQQERTRDASYSKWSSIPAIHKSRLIEDFIKRYNEGYNLSEGALKSIRICIYRGIQLGILETKNIILDDNHIKQIDDLEYDDEKDIFQFDAKKRELLNTRSKKNIPKFRIYSILM